MSRKQKRHVAAKRTRPLSLRESWRSWYETKRPLFFYGCRFVGVLIVFYLLSLTPVYQATLSGAVITIAHIAHVLMQGLGENSALAGATIRSGTDAIITVEPGCTGFNYSWFLAAAVAAFPASILHKALGILIGVAVLIALNVLRVSSLFWVGVHNPELFAFVHEQLWAVLLNTATVSLMVAWIVLIKPASTDETPATA